MYIKLLLLILSISNITYGKRKTADELDTPICTNDSQCALGGICKADNTGNKRCMCSASCLMSKLIMF